MSTRTNPGKMLGEMYIGEYYVGIYSPTSVTKCHRISVHHIWIELSILQIPFGLVLHGVVKNFGVMQYGPSK